MADSSQPQTVVLRDGTSQAGRVLAALDPGYVSVDERTLRDWLEFAAAYTRKLRFFDGSADPDLPVGDWSGFLGLKGVEREEDRRAVLDRLAGWAGDLKRWSALASDESPPAHVVLFLVFLETLRSVQGRLNAFTRRHLDFTYREVLGFVPRGARTDRVHVLLGLAPGQGDFLVPKGTMLQAGKDDLGHDRFFRTETDLVANQARVAELRSLYLRRRVIGLDDVRRDPELLLGLVVFEPAWLHFASPANKSLMAMLDLAFRSPGGAVESPKYPAAVAAGPKVVIDEPLLAGLDGLIEFVTRGIHLPLPVFRSLMSAKRGLEVGREPAASRWRAVNEILRDAGRAKRKREDFELPAAPADDFPTNLRNAVELPDDAFERDEMQEVNDIHGLYRHVDDADLDVKSFVEQRLFMTVDRFKTMMAIVESFHLEWQRIHEILRGAGRRRQAGHPAHRIEPTTDLRTFDPQRWETLERRNLGTLEFPVFRGGPLASLDQVYDELGRLESCFHMRSEDFGRVRAVLSEGAAARDWEGEEVVGILQRASAEKRMADGRAAIASARLPAHDSRQGLEAMVRRALGYPRPDDPLPGGRGFLTLRLPGDEAYVREELFLSKESLGFLQGLAAGPAPSANDWEAAVAILEQAGRRRRGESTASAIEVESWDNVYVALDATKVLSGSGLAEDRSTPRWRTFGEGARPDGATAPGEVGFLIGSPLLVLGEGSRTVIVSLVLADGTWDGEALEAVLEDQGKRPPFRCRLSGEKGWIDARTTQLSLRAATGTEKTGALEIRLGLGVQDAPVTVLPPEMGLPGGVPLLQVILADHDDEKTGLPAKTYTPFRSLRVVRVSLRVEVDGLTGLGLQNDESLLDARKPFEPFGVAPAVGSRLVFAHPELCTKKLSGLQLGIDWLGAPASLEQHYQGYGTVGGVAIAGNEAFTAAWKLRDHRHLVLLKKVKLFPLAKPGNRAHVEEQNVLELTEAEILATHKGYGWDPEPTAGLEPLDGSRCWILELEAPDFQHAVYPAAAARGAARTTPPVAPATLPTPNPLILNPPYTPKIKRLRAYYQATADVVLVSGTRAEAGALYHAEPFGIVRQVGTVNDPAVPLFPQLDDQGQLLIGVEGLEPPQNLSLLFQTAPGSADPDLAPDPVRWSCLDGDAWIDLDRGRVLSDTTSNLVNSGIILFDLPKVKPPTRLPSGRYWLRAAIARRARSVADLVAIHAQAVSAVRVDEDPEQGRSERDLPPETITELVTPVREIESVWQPYSSQGGAPPEEDAAMYRRASERLRHKDRALACWDYERAILEAFPEIYKVKCLPVGASEDPRLSGWVRVILIPDIRGRLPFDPFEPKVPAETLRAVEEFLARRISPLARVRVQNPRYATLQLRFNVRLRRGYNPGFYLERLVDDLRRFLSPWAYDQSADILFGGRITSSLIVHFVEERPYVDYLAGLTIFLEEEGRSLRVISAEELEQRASDPNSADLVLVSARQHEIDLIQEEYYADESFIGINHMKIEMDFRVA